MSFERTRRRTLPESYIEVANKNLINENNIVTSKTVDSFTVMHYTTVVAIHIRGRWYRDKTKYSLTTTRVLNGIFAEIGEDSIDISATDMQTLLNGGSL